MCACRPHVDWREVLRREAVGEALRNERAGVTSEALPIRNGDVYLSVAQAARRRRSHLERSEPGFVLGG